MPIGDRDNIMAFFFIGPKQDQSPYNREDIDNIIDFQAISSPMLVNTIMYKHGVENIQI